MEATFIDSENIKTSDHHRLILNLSYKRDLQRSGKHIALSNLSIYYIQNNIEKHHKNNKLNISAPTCNEKLKSPDRSYSVLKFKDYFEYSIKKTCTID